MLSDEDSDKVLRGRVSRLFFWPCGAPVLDGCGRVKHDLVWSQLVVVRSGAKRAIN